MTMATRIKALLDSNNLTAFSLYAGYGVDAQGRTVRFAVGTQRAERRNTNGRVTHAEYEYADGSTLTYTYNAGTERMTLTAKESRRVA